MPSKTNEQALEAAIEKALTGSCLETLAAEGKTLQEANLQYRAAHQYYIGNAQDYHAQYVLDEFRYCLLYTSPSPRDA